MLCCLGILSKVFPVFMWCRCDQLKNKFHWSQGDAVCPFWNRHKNGRSSETFGNSSHFITAENNSHQLRHKSSTKIAAKIYNLRWHDIRKTIAEIILQKHGECVVARTRTKQFSDPRSIRHYDTNHWLTAALRGWNIRDKLHFASIKPNSSHRLNFHLHFRS